MLRSEYIKRVLARCPQEISWSICFVIIQSSNLVYTDGARRPVSPMSAMTPYVKGQGRKVTWCVWQVLTHKPRTKSLINIKISIGCPPHGHWAITRTSFKIKQKSRSPGRLILRPKELEHEDPYHRRALWPPRSKSRCHVMRLTGVGPYVENEVQ